MQCPFYLFLIITETNSDLLYLIMVMGARITVESKYCGTPTNPHSCIPGGSSSGSAVAVAAGLVDFALGVFTSLLPHVIASNANNNMLIYLWIYFICVISVKVFFSLSTNRA